MTATLAEGLIDAPRPAAPAEARRRVASLMATPEGAGLASALAHQGPRDLLAAFAVHSPYLWTLATEDPARLVRLLGRSPCGSLDALIGGLAARREDDEAQLMRVLRLAKRESALLIALADIGGLWDLVATTEALTRFADAAVGAALTFLLRRNALAGRLSLDPESPEPQRGRGMVSLARRKPGAPEPHQSSDIDLRI